MHPRVNRILAMLQRTAPDVAELTARFLLIRYYLHTSNTSIVEITGVRPDRPRRLNLLAPYTVRGTGKVRVSAGAVLGWDQSPFSHRCGYIEARGDTALVEIGDETRINNAGVIISEGAGIHIGARCNIGFEFHVMDTNAHELEIGRRDQPDSRPQAVHIGDDVFIGSRVTVLKGCRVGRGAVLAAGSVLPPGFEAPPMSIVAGNPARVVGRVREAEGPGAPAPTAGPAESVESAVEAA
jgi:acetyltransferase-like isoleucine patch superfamily enzyme